MSENALVTGASSGLGRELVRQLVRDRGMTVLATARRLDRLEALAAELPEGRVLVEAGDLADPAFRDRLWARAEAMPGGLDLLVNNAGLGRYGAFEDQDFEAVRRIVEVNLLALMDLTRRAAAHMKARGSGQIVEVSSVLGFFGMPYSAVYVATKHAVNGLVKSLRMELKGTGVRVWAACPGRTRSEFSSVALGGTGAPDETQHGEPTERVVRGIVRGLDGRKVFVMPTLLAGAAVSLAAWLPGPFGWALARYAGPRFRGEIDRGRPAGPSPSAP
jgi:short-subunit dehydrogenase